MTDEWTKRDDELPRRGQSVWVYDAMFGDIIATTVVCNPEDMDGDITHWMPRTSTVKPKPPINGKVHARGYPK